MMGEYLLVLLQKFFYFPLCICFQNKGACIGAHLTQPDILIPGPKKWKVFIENKSFFKSPLP